MRNSAPLSSPISVREARGWSLMARVTPSPWGLSKPGNAGGDVDFCPCIFLSLAVNGDNMNRKMLVVGVVLAITGLTGCESDRTKPPGVMPQGARSGNLQAPRP